MAKKKNEYPKVKSDTWLKVDDQEVTVGAFVYDVPSLIFQSRNLQAFKIPMAAVSFEGIISDGNTRDFVKHMKAVLDADMSFPIIFDPAGRLLDGRHRIAKALFEQRDYILAVRFEEYPTYKKYKEDD